VALYLLAMLPATLFKDMGIVLSLAGTIGGSSLAYIGPGMLYLGVHGGRFLELVDDSWLVLSHSRRRVVEGCQRDADGGTKRKGPTLAVETTPLVSSMQEAVSVTSKVESDIEQKRQRQGEQAKAVRIIQNVVWYSAGFPLWCKIAALGKTGLTNHVHELTIRSPHPIRIGDVEYTLVAVSRSGRIEAECENAAVLMPLLRSESLPPLPALGQERTSIDLVIGRQILNEGRQKRSQKVPLQPDLQEQPPLEPDPQELPPTWRDFGLAIFFIIFGVVALMAGLFSLFATS